MSYDTPSKRYSGDQVLNNTYDHSVFGIRTEIINNSVPVTFSPVPSSGTIVINPYSEVTSVNNSTLVDVITYTVPVLKNLYLDQIECSGSNLATYIVDLNGSTIAKKRTYWTGGFNLNFNFGGLELDPGDIIKLQVIHSSSDTGDFEARITGTLVDQ